MSDKLAAHDLGYAYDFQATDLETGLPVPGRGAHRFTAFRQPVRLDHLAITRPVDMRGGRPQHVVITGYPGPEPVGQVLFDGELPWTADDTCCIDLPDDPVLAVSQRCDRRLAIEPGFMEWYPTRHSIPFDIFAGSAWYGEPTDALCRPEPPAPPPLRRGTIAPAGADGLSVADDGLFVTYRSDSLRIGFSLVRPRLSFLAWDGLGTGRVDTNFLLDKSCGFTSPPGSGPWRRHLAFELPPMLWTGTVEVDGTRVNYRNLRSLDGFGMDVEFDIAADGFTMSIRQHSDRERCFLEAEAWRWVWDGRRVYTLSTWARPLPGEHRNGLVEATGGWHATGRGVLAFAPVDGAATGMQVDIAGFYDRQAFTGLLLGARPEPFGPVTLLAGDHAATMAFRVTNLEPATAPETATKHVHPGLRRAWGSQFLYRAEHGGFSNNSFGVNAQNCLYLVADLAPYTQPCDAVPSMTELLRHTLAQALHGGPGYACFLDEAHDTAPAQLISAGRVYQAEGDAGWIRDLWPFLLCRVRHLLDSVDANGFYICRRLSGNAHSHCTSSNAWDTFCFGHADGYSGALAYRALRNAAVLAQAIDEAEMAAACARAAEHLRAAFVPTLLNPETGWLAGWRSADGELHDHAMHFVTALAAIYGILEPDQARTMLGRLEERRAAAGLDDFRYGLPPQFAPVPARDHWAAGGWARWEVPFRQDGADTYGIFTNGGVTPVFAGFYLRALSQFGFTDTADRLSDQLLDSFAAGRFEGCLNGAECYTLDGMPSGYEGTLAHTYNVLLAIGLHRGWITPLAPEWWPA